MGEVTDDIEEVLRKIMDENDLEKSVEAIKEASTKFSQVRSSSVVYNPQTSEPVIEIELFDENEQPIEYVKINTNVGKAFIRGSSECDFYIFYEKNGDHLVKYFQKNSQPNLQFIIKDAGEDMSEQLIIHLVAFKTPIEGRILSAGKVNLYFSNEIIADEHISKPLNGNDYFLYIGLPIIILVLLVGIILLIVYIIKLKKKNKENNDTPKADSKKSETIHQNATENRLITDISGKTENQQEFPVMGQNISNQPKIIYGAPPQNGQNQQIIYVMPESQMHQINRNSNMPNFGISNNTGTTNGNSDPRFSNMPSNLPSNLPSNFPNQMGGISGGHYGNSDPFKNDLDLNTPNEIPIYEVDMKEANDYTPGQKFQ